MKISLIISTYNKPQYLSCCLKSIACLKDFPDEIIVADDGSGEETFEVIEKFRREASVPVYHVWQEDKGFQLARSRNNAILQSSGDYLIFIDDDIILHPKFITDHLSHAKRGFFNCGTRVRLGEKLTTKAMHNLQNQFP